MSALPSTATVGVIGAGTMGAGIAQVAAAAGHPVLLYDTRPEAVTRGIAGIAGALEKLAAKGKMSGADKDALLARIMPCHDLKQMAPAQLVVEAILEDLEIKRKLFAELETLVSEDCVLATNTSALSITAIGAALKLPGRLVGMHFFNPVPLMALVEVVSGLATRPDVAQGVFDTSIAWGKSPVHAKSTPGFIVNRVARPYYGEALRVLGEGAADIAAIDAVMKEAGGFRMGPFELMDLIGHDVNLAVTKSVFAAYFHDPRYTPSLIQQELVAAGYLGRKSGRGFYDYREGATAPQPVAAASGPRPASVSLEGVVGVPHGLLKRIEQAGIRIERPASHRENGWLQVGTAILKMTDGRTATRRAHQEQVEDLVLFDLALDYATAGRIAMAAADQCSKEAVIDAAGLFQALGMQVSVIDDIAGMVVMRTVCMLANEGADAVNQGVCDAIAVDTAMQKGVNYPRGPLAWADAIGLDCVLNVLDNLAKTYGEDRYRASPLLRRKVCAGKKFHG